MANHGSHHTWGNVGYYISAAYKFFNAIGTHQGHAQPGQLGRLVLGRDAPLRLQHAAGPDRDLQPGRGPAEGSRDGGVLVGRPGVHQRLLLRPSRAPSRRQWLQGTGHRARAHRSLLQPHGGAARRQVVRAQAGHRRRDGASPSPRSGSPRALYDKKFVAERTVGLRGVAATTFSGKEDGIPKTPEWQEAETGIPAKDVRALARRWATKKTYLGAGGWGNGHGGACRSATGIQWARTLACLMAMQGMGRPGVNYGQPAVGHADRPALLFPRLCRRRHVGRHREHRPARSASTSACRSCRRSIPSTQKVPRLQHPGGHPRREGRGLSRGTARPSRASSRSSAIPAPGHAPVQMFYKYGGASIGTMNDTNRYVKAYRTDKLEFVVNQSIWFEGEAKFADVHPAGLHPASSAGTSASSAAPAATRCTARRR